jgi:hypothetical protein
MSNREAISHILMAQNHALNSYRNSWQRRLAAVLTAESVNQFCYRGVAKMILVFLGIKPKKKKPGRIYPVRADKEQRGCD